jgi:hypothetical protein
MATREVAVRLVAENAEAYAAKLAATKAVLADRERELLELKGPCSGAQGQACRLHYAHSGPCDARAERDA